MKESTLLVFDVNETLLDLTSLDDFFLDTFGDTQVMRQWFAEQILYSQTLTLSGRYVPFGELAVAVLKMVATIRNTALTPAQITRFQEEMAALPAHPDALPALEKLRTAGFEMVTFTNSSAEAGKKVLAQSGLAPFFSQQFSVELSGCFQTCRCRLSECQSGAGSASCCAQNDSHARLGYYWRYGLWLERCPAYPLR